MITKDRVISVADALFPGKEQYEIDEIVSIFENIHTLSSSLDKFKKPKIYKRFTNFLFNKNSSNLDTMILITALKGGGKSSTAIQLAREWCRIMGWPFNAEKYIAYTNADLSRKIDSLPPFSPLIADESVRFITSEDWNKKENKELKKKLAQIREKHLFFILCFPLKIKKVEKTYLESFVNYWIELYSRGSAAIFVRDNNPVFDSWRLDYFKNIGSYSEFTSEETIKNKMKDHPCFWKFMKIPKVPDKIYNKYKEIREKNVYRDDSDILTKITKEDIYQALMNLALNDVIQNDAVITTRRILLAIKNKYDIAMPEAELKKIINESSKMITTLRDNAMMK
jgi:hypothetical protein